MKRADNWLGLAPTIDTVEQAEIALQEIASILARDADLSAAYDVRLRRLNEERKAKLATVVDGETIPFSERVATLEAALLKWGDTQGVKLLDGTKTLSLRNGVFNWRKKADAVVFRDGVDEKTAVAKVSNVLPMLEEALEEQLQLCGALEITLKINRTNAKKAVLAGQLEKNRLGSIGLRFVPGVEYVSVAVAEIARDGTGENVEL